jgi:hypothetical protein
MQTREWGRSPNGPAWDGRRRWARRWGRIIPFIGLAVIAGGPAMAQTKDRVLYDTTRMLKHLGNECMGVPNCRTIESRWRRVSAGHSVSIVTQCPRTHPHLIGWDTEQSEHLGAHVAPTGVQSAFGQPVQAEHKGGARLTLLVTNNADAPGFIRVLLGCAEQETRTTAFRQYRGGNPSNLDSSAARGQK